MRDRVVFAGAVAGDELIDLYAGALAVVYAPFDEDYGYVTLEAFLCAKPVITATDSGGTLEFVVDGQNGFVCAPEPAAIGAALARLAADRALRRAARSGRARAGAADHMGRRRGAAAWLIRRRVSIVIPALNEEDAIGDVVSSLRAEARVARDPRRRRWLERRDG